MMDVVCGKVDQEDRVCCLPIGHRCPHESVHGPLISAHDFEEKQRRNRFLSFMDDLMFVLSYKGK